MQNRLVLQINNKCNYKCDFCYVKKGCEEMKYKTAKKAVEFLFYKPKFKIPKKEVIMMGGEPLLSKSLIKKIVLLIREKYGNNVVIGIPSNFSLLNENDLYFFNKMNVDLSWSIYPGFKDIYKNKHFLSNSINKKRVRIRFTVKNDLKSIMDFYKNFMFFEKYEFVKFDVSPVIGVFWPQDSINLFLKYIKKILKLAKHNKIQFIKLQDCKNNYNEYKTLAFCPRVYHEIFVNISGEVYPCQWYSSINKPASGSLGNINLEYRLLNANINRIKREILTYRVTSKKLSKDKKNNYNVNYHKFCLGNPAYNYDSVKKNEVILNNVELFQKLHSTIEEYLK